MGVLGGCKPRAEVLEGDLQDEIFAADFGHLIAGRAPKVYSDARIFFENTHPAEQIRLLTQAVFGRLADANRGGATIRLSTGFGGGKTHALMALWHLARNIGDLALGTDLLPAAGRPKKVTVVAVDASNAGVPIFATHGDITVHSLWGEIAYQFGGEKALEAAGKLNEVSRKPLSVAVKAQNFEAAQTQRAVERAFDDPDRARTGTRPFARRLKLAAALVPRLLHKNLGFAQTNRLSDYRDLLHASHQVAPFRF